MTFSAGPQIIQPMPVQQHPQYSMPHMHNVQMQHQYIPQYTSPMNVGIPQVNQNRHSNTPTNLLLQPGDGEPVSQKELLINGKSTALFLFLLSCITWAWFFLSIMTESENYQVGIGQGGVVNIFTMWHLPPRAMRHVREEQAKSIMMVVRVI